MVRMFTPVMFLWGVFMNYSGFCLQGFQIRRFFLFFLDKIGKKYYSIKVSWNSRKIIPAGLPHATCQNQLKIPILAI